jgi:hypothetical protein
VSNSAALPTLTNDNVLVVAHDAGAALYLAKLLKPLKYLSNITLIAHGPAKNIFEKNLSAPQKRTLRWLDNFGEHAFLKTQHVITGSGWSSNLEIDAINKVKSIGIKCSTVLDHWANYRRRMTRDAILTKPDEFWVFDDYAFNIAKKEFEYEKINILKFDDPIIHELILTLGSVKVVSGQILYITEPISKSGQMAGIPSDSKVTEDESFLEFARIIKFIGWRGHILVRVHPSENVESYRDLIKTTGIVARISTEPNPLCDIAKSEFIVGLESAMLGWAVSAGKPTYSILPLNGRVPCLPHSRIERFTNDTVLN